jgi:hypothetical protein
MVDAYAVDCVNLPHDLDKSAGQIHCFFRGGRERFSHDSAKFFSRSFLESLAAVFQPDAICLDAELGGMVCCAGEIELLSVHVCKHGD